MEAEAVKLAVTDRIESEACSKQCIDEQRRAFHAGRRCDKISKNMKVLT